jgi:hypothetical protein
LPGELDPVDPQELARQPAFRQAVGYGYMYGWIQRNREQGRPRRVADTQCGDYPAPCNCDDPVTHGGH